MKKMFTKRLLVHMAAALAVTMAVLFVFQTILTNRSNLTQSRVEAYIGFDMGSGEQSAAFLKQLLLKMI